MNNKLIVLIRKLLKEEPTVVERTSFINYICYDRGDRKYAFTVMNYSDETNVTFSILSDKDIVRHQLYSVQIEDERLTNEIKYRIEDCCAQLEENELNILEHRLDPPPTGMDALLESPVENG